MKLEYTHSNKDLRNILLGTTGLLVWRIVGIFTVFELTGGQEFSGDMRIFRLLMSDPWGFLTGEMPQFRQFPPLIGFALAPAAILGDWFGEFFGIRVYLVFLECVAFFVTAYALRMRRNYWLVLVFWALAPLTVFASTLVVQDEIISLVFAALLLLTALRIPRFGYLVSTLALLSAKIFFGLAYALQCVFDRKPVWIAGTLGLILSVYVIFILGFGSPPKDFVPRNPWSISIWSLAADSTQWQPDLQRKLSLLLWLVLFGLAGLYVRASASTKSPIVWFTIGFWTFLLSFYHVNPEYYLVVLPGALLILSAPMDIMLLFVAASVPWATNFFYSIVTGSSQGSVFWKVFDAAFFFLEPEIWHAASIVLSLALGLVVLWSMLRSVKERSQLGQET